jgi:hypothetical protein
MKKPEQCFVIMPFTETQHGNLSDRRVITKKQWDHIYDRWIKRAVESYNDGALICKRSPARPGNFIKGIIGDIATANLVIADLTGGRPNVYYELGIRHALRTGSIIITQHLSALPSDLASYFAFEYTYSDKDFEYEAHYRVFEASLHKTIKELEEAEDPSDSPVSDFLGLHHQLLERTLEEEKQEFRWLLQNIGQALAQNYQVCQEMHESIILKHDVEFTAFPVIDVFPLELLYTRLFSLPWKIHKPKNVQALAGLITNERLKFLMYARLYERASLGQPDDKVLAQSLVTLTDSIMGGRKHFEREWKKILGAKMEYKISWNRVKRRSKKAKSDEG